WRRTAARRSPSGSGRPGRTRRRQTRSRRLRPLRGRVAGRPAATTWVHIALPLAIRDSAISNTFGARARARRARDRNDNAVRPDTLSGARSGAAPDAATQRVPWNLIALPSAG